MVSGGAPTPLSCHWQNPQRVPGRPGSGSQGGCTVTFRSIFVVSTQDEVLLSGPPKVGNLLSSISSIDCVVCLVVLLCPSSPFFKTWGHTRHTHHRLQSAPSNWSRNRKIRAHRLQILRVIPKPFLRDKHCNQTRPNQTNRKLISNLPEQRGRVKRGGHQHPALNHGHLQGPNGP